MAIRSVLETMIRLPRNVDEIRLEGHQFASPIAASKELLRGLNDVELARQDFAVETTLPSRTYVTRVRRWASLGYHTVLHFIEVPSADFAVARVASRVAAGGHDIPEADIRRVSAVASNSFMTYTSRWCQSGTTGDRTTTESTLSQPNEIDPDWKLQALLEAARRANWDAMHGPRHLRTGRFFVSQSLEAHRSRPSAFARQTGTRDGVESAAQQAVEPDKGP